MQMVLVEIDTVLSTCKSLKKVNGPMGLSALSHQFHRFCFWDLVLSHLNFLNVDL